MWYSYLINFKLINFFNKMITILVLPSTHFFGYWSYVQYNNKFFLQIYLRWFSKYYKVSLFFFLFNIQWKNSEIFNYLKKKHQGSNSILGLKFKALFTTIGFPSSVYYFSSISISWDFIMSKYWKFCYLWKTLINKRDF